MNAAWPFAQLKLTADQLVLQVVLLGHTFSSQLKSRKVSRAALFHSPAKASAFTIKWRDIQRRSSFGICVLIRSRSWIDSESRVTAPETAVGKRDVS
jgi:hypothetical protein